MSLTMENEVSFPVGVILPAAGSGERLGNSIPKQYFDIQGKPLFLYAVELFEALPWISCVILVSDDVSKMQSVIKKRKENESSKVFVIKGGSTRHRSILLGLEALQKKSSQYEVVIVHDAVRPLVSVSIITHLVLAAHSVGAAGPTRPLISTVVSSDNQGFLANTLDRSKYLNSETPQAFRTSTLLQAYQKITDEELEKGTECLQLVLKHCGVTAKLIQGPEDLWKVTLRRDLHSAIGCITAKSSKVCLYMPENIQEAIRKIIPKLIQDLEWQVSKLTHIVGENGYSNGHTETIYNKIVIFHMGLKENMSFPFINLIDSKNHVKVHIILQHLQDNKEVFYKLGENFLKHDSDSVIIFLNDINESHKLVAMITNVILNENLFKNQILFV